MKSWSFRNNDFRHQRASNMERNVTGRGRHWRSYNFSRWYTICSTSWSNGVILPTKFLLFCRTFLHFPLAIRLCLQRASGMRAPLGVRKVLVQQILNPFFPSFVYSFFFRSYFFITIHFSILHSFKNPLIPSLTDLFLKAFHPLFPGSYCRRTTTLWDKTAPSSSLRNLWAACIFQKAVLVCRYYISKQITRKIKTNAFIRSSNHMEERPEEDWYDATPLLTASCSALQIQSLQTSLYLFLSSLSNNGWKEISWKVRSIL